MLNKITALIDALPEIFAIPLLIITIAAPVIWFCSYVLSILFKGVI